MYSTDFCPKNETEWKTRSNLLNCTEENGYTCLPNEHFTELLEFCYIDPHILIEKGQISLCNYPILIKNYNSTNIILKLCWKIKMLLIQYKDLYIVDIMHFYYQFSISGLCLYLIKSNSLVHGYKCNTFQFGCPTSSYLSTKIYNCKC